jgi:hypothetical protein
MAALILLRVISLVLGIVGIGYSARTLQNGYIEVYSPAKKQLVEYRGRAARIVSTGILAGSFGLLMGAILGWAMWPLMAVGAVAYYGSLYLANQIKD